MGRPDYCPVWNVPCQSLCDEPCTTSSEINRLRDLADEYNRLMRHMDAGGDFFAFQVAEAGRRNAPVPNANVTGLAPAQETTK